MPIKGKKQTTKKRTCRLFSKNSSYWEENLDWYWTREIFSLRIRGIEESNSSSSSFTESTSRRRWAVHFWRIKGNLQNSFPHSIHWSDDRWKACLTAGGGAKGSSSTVLMIQEQLFISELFRKFRTQSYWSFITGQCCDSEQFLPIYLPYWMCFQSSFYHQLWINTWRSKFSTRDRQYSSCLLILLTKVTRTLMILTWMYHVMHNSCTMHGRDIKTRYIGLTSILLLRKDCISIRLDRTQLFFRKHFQLIVFQKFLE